MYSQCPDCLARFRVTAAVLRAAHGTVRCGRCGSAFDALARLSDTLPEQPTAARLVDEPARSSATMARTAVPTGREPAPAPTEYHFSVDDIEKVFVDAQEWQRQFGSSTGHADVPAEKPEPLAVMVDEPEDIEDITLEGERIDIEGLDELDELQDAFKLETQPEAHHDLDSTDRFEVLVDVPDSAYPAEDEEPVAAAAVAAKPVIAGEPPAPAPAAAVAAAAASSPVAPATVTPRRDFPSGRWRPPPATVEPAHIAVEPRADDVDAEDDEVSRGGAIAWTLGCLLLALALAAQITHHFRQDLVRNPQLGPALRSVYETLGLPLAPNWDPAAFELRQWGAADSPQAPGRMSVRASLTNRAEFAQPFPLLRLQLEDRFGGAVATRDFEPRDYLKDPALATRMFSPGAKVEARIDIVDPGNDAVGYRLDVCLRESDKLLRCAQGPG